MSCAVRTADVFRWEHILLHSDQARSSFSRLWRGVDSQFCTVLAASATAATYYVGRRSNLHTRLAPLDEGSCLRLRAAHAAASLIQLRGGVATVGSSPLLQAWHLQHLLDIYCCRV